MQDQVVKMQTLLKRATVRILIGGFARLITPLTLTSAMLTRAGFCGSNRAKDTYGVSVRLFSLKSYVNALHVIRIYENGKRIIDEDISKIANMCMEVYGKKGFGLGAHTSQIYTNIAVTPLDHYIKDKLRVKEYGRYVDDFYFFAETKEQATNAYYSWKGHMKRGNSYKIIQKMDKYKLDLIDKFPCGFPIFP